jgi:16S rRNA (cytidine1402-2'-O)-methyltransferase
MVPRAGTLFVVATPIGNLEDITHRALRVLREVSLIAAEDTRRTARLLARFAIQTPMTSLHEHNETHKAPSLLRRLQQGENLALVSDAGTPTVSDPGETLIRAAIGAGVRVEAVPGASAAIAALAASGLSGENFAFLGFPPTRGKDRIEWFDRLLKIGCTAVFFEAPHRILATLEKLRAVAGECQVCIARELTKAHEELVRGPISEAISRLGEPRGEYTVVVKICHMPDLVKPIAATGPLLLQELGDITNCGGVTRRKAISSLAKRHSMAVNDVYDAIEKTKKSVL